jgi:hypothetical protein
MRKGECNGEIVGENINHPQWLTTSNLAGEKRNKSVGEKT